MADYIYLLENRLSAPQRNALHLLREIARAKSLTLFLVGGAVRDLTSGSPVRDLDVTVQGNAFKLKKDIEKSGAVVTGEYDAMQALYLRFPGSVRVELSTALSVTYPKPGKAVAKPATILDDLRRRDFTANAMALSLNEGSYGLLMDPLNGVADIENRQLRLVSNYGFLEDPVRMIRAVRLMARLGWTLDERTQTRYENGVQEGYIGALSDFQRGYELEEILHEEDPLRVLRRLESEGWMKHLAPFFTLAKANVAEVDRLREVQTQLEMQNLHPDTGAANFPLLTARLSAKELATLKASFPRPGFVAEIESLETQAKEFAAQLSARAVTLPSQAWKMILSASPEAVLWTAFSNKSAPVQAKLKSFGGEWPQARQKIPYTLMQEMRITPDLPGYEALLETLFFELMDGKLAAPEEMKAFLEPHSPPAPPPPVTLRRLRAAAKKEARPGKSRKKAAVNGSDEAADESADAGKSSVPSDSADGTTGQSSAAAPDMEKGDPPAAPVRKPVSVKRASVAAAAGRVVKAEPEAIAKKAAAKKTGSKPAPKKGAGPSAASAKPATAGKTKPDAPAKKKVSKAPAPSPAKTAKKPVSAAAAKGKATAGAKIAAKNVPARPARPAGTRTASAARPASPAAKKAAPQKTKAAPAKTARTVKAATKSPVKAPVKAVPASPPRKQAPPAKAVARKAVPAKKIAAKVQTASARRGR